MRIEIVSPMLAAFRSGVNTYTPVFDGQELGLEDGDTPATLRNLDKLIGPDRKIIRFYLAKGQVLVIFDTGETYLATGFHYGHEQDQQKVRQFALFASKHGFGDDETLTTHLSALSANHFGPLEPETRSLNGQIRIMTE